MLALALHVRRGDRRAGRRERIGVEVRPIDAARDLLQRQARLYQPPPPHLREEPKGVRAPRIGRGVSMKPGLVARADRPRQRLQDRMAVDAEPGAP